MVKISTYTKTATSDMLELRACIQARCFRVRFLAKRTSVPFWGFDRNET